MPSSSGNKPPEKEKRPPGGFQYTIGSFHSDPFENTQKLLAESIHLEPRASRSTFYFLAKKENLHSPPSGQHLFGGQILSQALRAASLTVDGAATSDAFDEGGTSSNAKAQTSTVTLPESVMSSRPVATSSMPSRPPRKHIHSFHGYFLGMGSIRSDVSYRVRLISDGRSFSTRNVDAIQEGRVIFSCIASFQKREPVPEPWMRYQENFPQEVDQIVAGGSPSSACKLSSSSSGKETNGQGHQNEMRQFVQEDSNSVIVESQLRPYDEAIFASMLRASSKHQGDEKTLNVRHHRDFRGGPTPLDLRPLVLSSDWPAGTPDAPGRMLWLVKTRDRIPSDNVMYHQSVLAHMSDTNLAVVAFAPIGGFHRVALPHCTMMCSLDHALWFHVHAEEDGAALPWRADEWLVFDCTCYCMNNSRAIVRGNVYCYRTRALVASLCQELLIRLKSAGPALPHKTARL
ncbi:unnamed protein product [Amoebophrya sp. A25]|nr:unnamed protein product [Amoebophrya sp. A25]|eukprot:GSA25T00018647001.1